MTIPYVAIVMVSRDWRYGFCRITMRQSMLESRIPMTILERLGAQVVAWRQELVALLQEPVALRQELVAWRQELVA